MEKIITFTVKDEKTKLPIRWESINTNQLTKFAISKNDVNIIVQFYLNLPSNNIAYFAKKFVEKVDEILIMHNKILDFLKSDEKVLNLDDI